MYALFILSSRMYANRVILKWKPNRLLLSISVVQKLLESLNSLTYSHSTVPSKLNTIYQGRFDHFEKFHLLSLLIKH